MAANAFLLHPVSSLFLIIVSTLSLCLFPCSCDLSSLDIFSCLTHHNINNFTTYSSANRNYYYNILYFSLNNLRFAGLSVPKPTAIILPSTKEQLVNSLLCSKRASLEIRVRCGGHSYEGTSSVVTDGSPFVIIDMMNINRISVDLEGEVAWVEGGATLGETYSAIAQSGEIYGFSAGLCPTVGIGGHISGGGYGLMSRKYGLAADNVVDALLMDADGRFLDREAMGEDLFWAIRGGGGGVWGIIYAWKIRLLRVPKVVTGLVVSRPGTKHHVATLVHKWQSVAPKLEDGFYLLAYVGAGLPETTGVNNMSATFKGLYQGPRRKAVSILKRAFPELGVMEEDCKEMSWIDSVIYFSGLKNGSTVSDLGKRYFQSKVFFKSKLDYVRTPIPLGGIEVAMDVLEKQPKGYLYLEPYGGIMEEIASDSIAFPHRRGNLFAIQYLLEWKDEDNEKSKEYMEWVRGLYGLMTPYVSSGPRAATVNYMDLDLGEMGVCNSSSGSCGEVEKARVWGEKYFLQNYDRLVKAKTLIDPHNFFRNQQGIPSLSSTMAESDLKILVSEMR